MTSVAQLNDRFWPLAGIRLWEEPPSVTKASRWAHMGLHCR